MLVPESEPSGLPSFRKYLFLNLQQQSELQRQFHNHVTFILIGQSNPDSSDEFKSQQPTLTYAYKWGKSIGLRWASNQQASSYLDRQAIRFQSKKESTSPGTFSSSSTYSKFENYSFSQQTKKLFGYIFLCHLYLNSCVIFLFYVSILLSIVRKQLEAVKYLWFNHHFIILTILIPVPNWTDNHLPYPIQ